VFGIHNLDRERERQTDRQREGGLFLIQENIWGMLLYSVNKFTFLSTQLMYNVLMLPKKIEFVHPFVKLYFSLPGIQKSALS
jgi:hypothetical protein